LLRAQADRTAKQALGRFGEYFPDIVCSPSATYYMRIYSASTDTITGRSHFGALYVICALFLRFLSSSLYPPAFIFAISHELEEHNSCPLALPKKPAAMRNVLRVRSMYTPMVGRLHNSTPLGEGARDCVRRRDRVHRTSADVLFISSFNPSCYFSLPLQLLRHACLRWCMVRRCSSNFLNEGVSSNLIHNFHSLVRLPSFKYLHSYSDASPHRDFRQPTSATIRSRSTKA